MSRRILVDVGNTRIKLARLSARSGLKRVLAVSSHRSETWEPAIARMLDQDLNAPSTWLIATVNPVAADRLADILDSQANATVRLVRSARDVPVPHALRTPSTTGVDRALMVLAALGRQGFEGPGQVISCGTAVTVEWIEDQGVWQGGAIAPGLGPTAKALNLSTAQLPHVKLQKAPPGAWGNSTKTALRAGILWSVVGSIRELLRRQALDSGRVAWRLWTGGDAPMLAPLVDGPEAAIAPRLVLEGLARLMPEILP